MRDKKQEFCFLCHKRITLNSDGTYANHNDITKDKCHGSCRNSNQNPMNSSNNNQKSFFFYLFFTFHYYSIKS